MKKFLSSILVVALMISGTAQVVQAQGSFLIGAVFGAILFGGDGDGQATTGSGATVLYTLQRASERVTSPLNIRLSAVNYNGYRERNVEVESGNWKPNKFESKKIEGLSIREIFSFAVPEPEKYEILQVIRAPHAGSTIATFWFAYVEKKMVVPLENLLKGE